MYTTLSYVLCHCSLQCEQTIYSKMKMPGHIVGVKMFGWIQCAYGNNVSRCFSLFGRLDVRLDLASIWIFPFPPWYHRGIVYVIRSVCVGVREWILLFFGILTVISCFNVNSLILWELVRTKYAGYTVSLSRHFDPNQRWQHNDNIVPFILDFVLLVSI